MTAPSIAPAGRPTLDASKELAARIFDAARQEFLAKGIEGASIEGIAAAAGCSKLTIYRRFGSKNELFMTLVKERAPDYGVQFHVDVTQAPEQVLYQLGLGIAAFFFKPESLRFIRMVVAEMSRVEGLPELMKNEADRFREPVKRCLEALKSSGKGRFEDSTLAAIQFINLCVLGHFYLIAGYTSEEVSPEQQEKLVRSAVALFVSTYFPQNTG
ncbi:TetR family transcriptional regulator [Duganella sp. FT135W]|uniref:TetR family transcriptional regulator n=1 Tax=Duganella flavida TaxID=2692175 RepID=A0A6L8KBM6_9BURK|nr:TetR/AcrR family transcriptional regulator [Duganella flavida]MYM23638.1 TetR family transcriptional regulator [Duganella flavida]